MYLVPILMLLFFIVFFALAFTLIRFATKKEDEVYSKGIEVDSTVSRSESYLQYGNHKYRTFVKFIGDDDVEHEGRINVATNLPAGRKVRIRYLPGQYDEVVFVSQELD